MEHPLYRQTLEEIHRFYPGIMQLTAQQVANMMSCSAQTARRRYRKGFVKGRITTV